MSIENEYSGGAEDEPLIGVDEAEYERDKGVRIMPDDLRTSDYYFLRVLTPPNSRPPFAFEKLMCLLDIDEIKSEFELTVSEVNEEGEVIRTSVLEYSNEGFVMAKNSGAKRYLESPEGWIPIGYFLGAVDDLDSLLAEVVETQRELNLV